MKDNHSDEQCQLIEKVIHKGICVTCGACVGLCPYFDYFDGKVVVVDSCHSETGRCLQLCPRTDYMESAIERAEKKEFEGKTIGAFKEIFIARSKGEGIRERAQYGGVVSALLTYALDKKLIASAVLTDRGNGISPTGRIAREVSDILGCAGSRYTASGSLAALNRAIKNGEEKIGVVGLPCQIEAMNRMGLMVPDGKERSSRISLKIGLFCTWALDYRKLSIHLKDLGIESPIRKYDIPPPPSQVFQILTEKGLRELPLEDIRPFIQRGCSLCEDMTAEGADISVGTVEGLEGWNTVVVRTVSGATLVNDAIHNDIVEKAHLLEVNLKHLKEASLNKRKRGMMAKMELRQKDDE
ncbi:MAG: Coenzyme F420 hydrogenase/dehydrogenase, beta subunit C-terminal domain [Pseudomonadota bacterium]